MNHKMNHKDSKDKVLVTLKKAQSHIGRIIEMLEENAYCIDVIQQINAVNGYLNSARKAQLKNHLHTCFAGGIETPNQKVKEKLIDEVISVIKISE